MMEKLDKRIIKFGAPCIKDEEKNAVADVLGGDILVHGKKLKQFEEDFARFTGAPYAIAVSSCTAALHLSYFAYGIGAGDEVIVPAQTHVATVHAVEFVGAHPVFVDAEPATGNIGIDKIEEKITEKTRAISVVHFLGIPVNMKRIMTIAEKYNLKVIEDCALAIGSRIDKKHVGLFGDTGCFSFYPVKHITTAEGGMIITRHKEVAEKLHFVRAFGVDRTPAERTIPGSYDVTMLGFNYRMNEIQAAIGIEQIKKLGNILEKRKNNFIYLKEKLAEIPEIAILDCEDKEATSSHYCLSIVLDESIALKCIDIINFLKEHGVGTSIYYPKPVPHFTYYKEKYGYHDNSFPVASAISYASIALPVGPHLNEEDLVYVVQMIKEAFCYCKK